MLWRRFHRHYPDADVIIKGEFELSPNVVSQSSSVVVEGEHAHAIPSDCSCLNCTAAQPLAAGRRSPGPEGKSIVIDLSGETPVVNQLSCLEVGCAPSSLVRWWNLNLGLLFLSYRWSWPLRTVKSCILASLRRPTTTTNVSPSTCAHHRAPSLILVVSCSNLLHVGTSMLCGVALVLTALLAGVKLDGYAASIPWIAVLSPLPLWLLTATCVVAGASRFACQVGSLLTVSVYCSSYSVPRPTRPQMDLRQGGCSGLCGAAAGQLAHAVALARRIHWRQAGAGTSFVRSLRNSKLRLSISGVGARLGAHGVGCSGRSDHRLFLHASAAPRGEPPPDLHVRVLL